ncbi:MAG: hypothetical protein RL095_2193 [Verrucomicrobiota bacterium]|jgi:hypothetical protein
MHESPQWIRRGDWLERAEGQRRRLDALVGDYVAARRQGRHDAVLEFLFEYYSFPPGRLARWSPSPGCLLEGPLEGLGNAPYFRPDGAGWGFDPERMPRHRRRALEWTRKLLRRSAAALPHLACFGLHEWAMVERDGSHRHHRLPLRFPAAEIADLVARQGTSCTHYDAFRFFTAEAAPKNLHQTSRDRQEEFEQPACLHANMDLYKWANKLHPWIEGELLLDCLELALDCRRLDMQASPYDLAAQGLPPVPVETAAGREEYARRQRSLMLRAQALRPRLAAAYDELLEILPDGSCATSETPN